MQAIFDSSSLISIAETCLMDLLEKFSEGKKIEFVISRRVEREAVVKPLQIHRFELNALRIKKAIDAGWIKLVDVDYGLQKEIKKIEGVANKIFSSKGKYLRLIDYGEAEALALVNKIGAKVLIIDERTTRMLVENPLQLKKFMEERQRTKITVDGEKLNEFKEMFPDLAIVRSVELLALAFEKGFFEKELEQSKQALEAALYAVKYRGCAVSSEEIENFLKSK